MCRLPLEGGGAAAGAPAGPPPGAVAGPPPGAGGPPPGVGGPPPGAGGMPAGVQKLASSPIMKPKFLALLTGLTWALVAGLPNLVYALADWDSTTGPKIALFILLVPTIVVAAVAAVGLYFIANIPVPVFGEQWRTASAVLCAVAAFVTVNGVLTLLAALAR